MNRRQLLQTLIGGGLTLMTAHRNTSAAPQQTLDMVGHSYTDIPFQSLNGPNPTTQSSSPGYTWKGVHQRFTWAMADVRTPRKVLFQAAVQSPAYFSVFLYNSANSIPSVTSGNNNPYLWRTSYKGNWAKANYVSQYLDLPKGTYVFMGHDETTGVETNNCSMSIRDMVLPGQPLPYSFVNSQPLLGIGPENTETPVGPFQVVDAKNEICFLRGCVNESNGGQIIEILYEPQFLLWQQKKPYKPTFTLPHHFHSQYIAGATNTKWYLLLKNPGRTPSVATNSPVSLSYVWERWRKG
jgi:hypothetical protein